MNKIRILLANLLLVSPAMAGFECKVGDKWYPYTAAECQGKSTDFRQAPRPATNPGPSVVQRPADGLPSYEALWSGQSDRAKAYCAELHDSYFLQDVCLQNEKKGYMALKSNYGLPSDKAVSAKGRCAKLHKSWFLRDVCMKNESEGYQKLHGK